MQRPTSRSGLRIRRMCLRAKPQAPGALRSQLQLLPIRTFGLLAFVIFLRIAPAFAPLALSRAAMSFFHFLHVSIFALLGQSAPSFWIGIMLVWIFAVEINWFPTSGKGGIEHIVLPAITLGWFQVAAIMRLVRSSMLDTLNSEYVMLARIKGLFKKKS